MQAMANHTTTATTLQQTDVPACAMAQMVVEIMHLNITMATAVLPTVTAIPPGEVAPDLGLEGEPKPLFDQHLKVLQIMTPHKEQ